MVETRKLARCAIYTRKSTDHNLDLEFNSLDAQREACEAYIKSQAHEGWRLVPDRFDDGGISGASLDRPALKELISEIEAGKIDIVVVYKVDRLTRSLTDFAKLVELFERHEASFVSITQAFNTTSSMGRLTLNVLLSFAQFEREVIGERVRDKIAASKRKGLWMGGPVPLGYVAKDKKLVVLPAEAETVRLVFRKYLELGAIGPLLQELDRLGVTTKARRLADGRTIGGGRFGKGALNHFLRNRCYVGEIEHRGQVFIGCHEPILDRDLFDAVQAKLAGNAVERRLSLKSTAAPLTGKIYDDRGNRMGPSHTIKGGVRYRYYVSKAVLQRRPSEAGSVPRVPAVEIEELVAAAVEENSVASPEDGAALLQLDQVVVKRGAIEVRLVAPSEGHEAGTADQVLTIPWVPTTGVMVKGVVGTGREMRTNSPKNRDALLTAIGKARLWMDELVEDSTTIAQIAKREGSGERYIRLLLPLAFVSPPIAEILADSIPTLPLKIGRLAQSLSNLWSRQLHMTVSGGKY